MSYGSGHLVESFFGWLGELLIEHPISFVVSVPVAGFLTYKISMYIADDVNRRNKKLGVEPPDNSENFTGVMLMGTILFSGLLFGFYSLLNWFGTFLSSNPGF
jgi:hypothetical protein